jgi:hypothetical protein
MGDDGEHRETETAPDFWAVLSDDPPPRCSYRREAVDTMVEWITDHALDIVPEWEAEVERLGWLECVGSPHTRHVMALADLHTTDDLCRSIALAGGLSQLAGLIVDALRRDDR